MFKSNCEYCLNFVYDEEYGEEICEVDMDMDELEHFMHGSYKECPYYRSGDEYKVVRHQM